MLLTDPEKHDKKTGNPTIQACLQHHVAGLEKSLGIDLYSHEFIFGNNKEHIRARNKSIFLTPNGYLSLLRTMLRYGLDNEKRRKIFQSPYELGYLEPKEKSNSEAQLSLAALARYVWKERAKEGGDDKKEFESITDALKKITGKSFSEYPDKKNSLGVIYLLDRISNNPAYSRQGKRPLTFLKTPSSKYSYEFRGNHPTKDSEYNSFFFNELKAYLSIEIPETELKKIEGSFYLLIQRLTRIENNLLAIIPTSGKTTPCLADKKHTATVYLNLKNRLLFFNPITDSEKPASKPRLDQDLYTHLHRLEFLHFIGELKNTLSLAKPPSPITSIKNEMISSLGTIILGNRTFLDIVEPNFQLNHFPALTQEASVLFLSLVEEAIKLRPNKKQYKKIVSLSYELLCRIKLFSIGIPSLPKEHIPISFIEIVTSLCAVAQALAFRTQYRSKIYGTTNQPKSILTPLERRCDDWEIQEGYFQLWDNRFKRVRDALTGDDDIGELKFELQMALCDKAVECVSLQDIDSINRALTKLGTDLLSMN